MQHIFDRPNYLSDRVTPQTDEDPFPAKLAKATRTLPDGWVSEDIALAAQLIPGTSGKEQRPSLFDRYVINRAPEPRSPSPHAIDQACGPNDIGFSSSLPAANDSRSSGKRGSEDRRVMSKYAFYANVTPSKKPQTVQRNRWDDAPPAPATETRITESRKQSGSSCPEPDPPSTLVLDPAKDSAVMRSSRRDTM
ncbi:MAG: hypothetical protein Q9205_004522 [Flavoplaca limonia]